MCSVNERLLCKMCDRCVFFCVHDMLISVKQKSGDTGGNRCELVNIYSNNKQYTAEETVSLTVRLLVKQSFLVYHRSKCYV